MMCDGNVSLSRPAKKGNTPGICRLGEREGMRESCAVLRSTALRCHCGGPRTRARATTKCCSL